MKTNRLLCLLGLFIVGTQGHAQDSYGYLGGGIGNLDYEESASAFTLSLNFSDSAPAYKVYGGYRFSESLAVEASYAVTGDLEDSIPDIFGFGAPLGISLDFDVLTVRALGYIPLASFSLFGGIGYFDADPSDISITIPGVGSFNVPAESDDGATANLGLEWALDAASIRVEFEFFDTESGVDVWALGVGAHWRF